MSLISFYSHNSSKYTVDKKHLACLSQWYINFTLNCSGASLSRIPITFSYVANKNLKNDWLQRCNIPIKDYEDKVSNLEFYSREAWMMWHKAFVFGFISPRSREVNEAYSYKIITLTDSSTIKKLGRSIKDYNDKVWGDIRYEIVFNGNYLQFSQDPLMKEALLKTGDAELVEASPYDFIWGIGVSQKNISTTPRDLWGQNLLGKILVEVRNLL